MPGLFPYADTCIGLRNSMPIPPSADLIRNIPLLSGALLQSVFFWGLYVAWLQEVLIRIKGHQWVLMIRPGSILLKWPSHRLVPLQTGKDIPGSENATYQIRYFKIWSSLHFQSNYCLRITSSKQAGYRTSIMYDICNETCRILIPGMSSSGI